MVFWAGGACPTPVGYGEGGMLCRATPFSSSLCFQQQVHGTSAAAHGVLHEQCPRAPQWGWWSAGCADQPPWHGCPVLSQPCSSHSSPFSGGGKGLEPHQELSPGESSPKTMGTELLPSRTPGTDAVLAHRTMSSPGSCESSLPCPSLTMVDVSIGEVEFERTWCNEELMSFIWGGNPKQNNNKTVSQQKLLVPQSLRNAGKAP